ncbi:hypothetical protein BURMUCGD2M_4765 [Burkholderia multivorans CGD2M]|nr:hypothetical protein BURMUCGD1_4336 [Burkholderia multivorans CGD1]EEE15322.1 hypothetical protein BURMUCGD2M_4765 [Burkholderia multivorans CGD2M]
MASACAAKPHVVRFVVVSFRRINDAAASPRACAAARHSRRPPVATRGPSIPV